MDQDIVAIHVFLRKEIGDIFRFKNMRLIIGADLVPTSSNENRFKSKDEGSLVGARLESFLNTADYRIFNCEIPLTSVDSTIEKSGPNLKASPECINGYVSLQTNFVTLSNNHIMDYGSAGMLETVQLLKKAGIDNSGVGHNREDAAQLFITEISGMKVGIYCCVEHEFSFATKEKEGANPFDPLYSLDHITKLRQQSDLVIVLYHGGRELYQYPTPGLQERCRRIVDFGADIVLCQHSHCIGAREIYKGKHILYGQGNFIFDRTDNPLTKVGLLVEITYDHSIEVNYIPVMVTDGIADIPDEMRREEILDEFFKRSQQIEDGSFVEEEFDRLCQRIMHNYLFSFRGGSVLAKVFNKLSHGVYVKRIYKKKKALLALNNIQCETHREVSLRAFQMAARD